MDQAADLLGHMLIQPLRLNQAGLARPLPNVPRDPEPSRKLVKWQVVRPIRFSVSQRSNRAARRRFPGSERVQTCRK